MKWCAGLTLAVLLVPAGRAADPPAPTAKDELQRFQGTWRVEAWVEGGKAVPAADLKKRGVFFGANVFVFRRDGKVYQAGTVQLDPAKTPRTADLRVLDGAGKGGLMPGAYTLAGDTLTLAFDPEGQTRPAGVQPDPESGAAVVTLRKPKPPADERLEIAGKYRSELVEATGKVVVTDAVVERRGDAYLVTYTQGDKLLFVGTALRKGDQLSMCWVSAGQVGVSVYKIEPGPKLTGEYTTLAGVGATAREVLTPWRRVD